MTGGRLEKMICEKCKQKNVIAGQAFTRYKCEVCEKECMHHNTNTPKLCKECAQKLRKCQRCGEDLRVNNTGKNEIKLFFTDEELLTIENTFAVIKKGGSKLEDKEAMMKLLILKETRVYDVLNFFEKFRGQKDGNTGKD